MATTTIETFGKLRFRRLFSKKLCSNEKMYVLEYVPEDNPDETTKPTILGSSRYVVAGYNYYFKLYPIETFKSVEEAKNYIQKINKSLLVLVQAERILRCQKVPTDFIPRYIKKYTDEYQKNMQGKLAHIEGLVLTLKRAVSEVED